MSTDLAPEPRSRTLPLPTHKLTPCKSSTPSKPCSGSPSALALPPSHSKMWIDLRLVYAGGRGRGRGRGRARATRTDSVRAWRRGKSDVASDDANRSSPGRNVRLDQAERVSRG